MKVKIPRQDGSWVVEPKPDSWPHVLQENKCIFNQLPDKVFKIRSLFYKEAGFGLSPIVMTGHQPDWFHPGVWAKNFLVHRIASVCDGIGINCVIDSDIPKTFACNIPIPSDEKNLKRPISVPFLPLNGKYLPWELQKPISNDNIAQSFLNINNICREFNYESLASYALKSLSKSDRSRNAACQFAGIRNHVEFIMGVQIKDLFLSNISSFHSFIELIRILFNEINLVFKEYNQAILYFRETHNIRRPGRPIPFLEKDNDWFETPLWIYSYCQPERSRLWIKKKGNVANWRSSNNQLSGKFYLGNLEDMAANFHQIELQGVFIRPRALLISLFLRVFASNLFIQGLGGALYDEMTDRWIKGWFGIKPPISLVCSLTMLLPLFKSINSYPNIYQIKKDLREVRWHGEKIKEKLDNQVSIDSLAFEKTRLLDWSPCDVFGKKERYKALRAINQEIYSSRYLLATKLLSILNHEKQWINSENLLKSRELPWIIHPKNEIQIVMQKLMGQISG